MEGIQPPPEGNVEPDAEPCPICGQKTMALIDAREPLGFFSGKPKDFDGTFEWVPRSTRPMIYAGTDQLAPLPGRNMAFKSISTDVASINDNGGKGGFDFYSVPIPGLQGTGAYAVSPYDGHKLEGKSYRIGLLSERHTDVLMAEIGKWPAGIYANPQELAGRAAWYSLAFLLRIAATSILDIDVQELQAGIRTIEGNDGTPRGQVFLSDTLENGAGYCRWLGIEDNLNNVLSACADIEDGKVGKKWIADDHLGCDTSCNHCLRDYYNMPYHGLLDWRLAMEMARIATDPSARFDLATPMSKVRDNPWRSLFEGSDAPITRTLKQFGFDRLEYGQAPVYVSTNPRRKRILIGSHPLWTETHPDYTEAASHFSERYPEHEIERLDLFIAMRRPADYI